MTSRWGISPKQSVNAECARRGRAELIAGCISLLEGRSVDDDLLLALAGPAALSIMGGLEGGREGYWPRVWGARGLLHVWSDGAAAAIIAAASDDSWRVREMIAKVIAAHAVDRAIPTLVALMSDPVPRVRRAAERALMILTT